MSGQPPDHPRSRYPFSSSLPTGPAAQTSPSTSAGGFRTTAAGRNFTTPSQRNQGTSGSGNSSGYSSGASSSPAPSRYYDGGSTGGGSGSSYGTSSYGSPYRGSSGGYYQRGGGRGGYRSYGGSGSNHGSRYSYGGGSSGQSYGTRNYATAPLQGTVATATGLSQLPTGPAGDRRTASTGAPQHGQSVTIIIRTIISTIITLSHSRFRVVQRIMVAALLLVPPTRVTRRKLTRLHNRTPPPPPPPPPPPIPVSGVASATSSISSAPMSGIVSAAAPHAPLPLGPAAMTSGSSMSKSLSHDGSTSLATKAIAKDYTPPWAIELEREISRHSTECHRLRSEETTIREHRRKATFELNMADWEVEKMQQQLDLVNSQLSHFE
ncbi:hypothetical protein THASP1DRAFT_23135 [Thamnocephalis sphaerospora]|uniref:Uncharacterized protein n=1 Tax=Thamnocephalis sphaerospora TaxID=78915 RepID=A0A4V1IWW4_9FUNG|nr:hypothetical protein THASP1DRAFT_23135 [Thamnocephalis sphaerospora]|eukprot:RKP08969.1 hypothetical protein THASP1DRAFT_23135 [Thamnocephalis sphaerospora]